MTKTMRLKGGAALALGRTPRRVARARQGFARLGGGSRWTLTLECGHTVQHAGKSHPRATHCGLCAQIAAVRRHYGQ